jgi:toxin YoeB
MSKLRTIWASSAVRDKYLDIKNNYPEIFKKLKALYKDICRSPYLGIGKPHRLKENYAGWYSRHITGACNGVI